MTLSRTAASVFPATHELPLAAAGLNSYRYTGRYGFVMIGAASADKALQEVARSISGPAAIENLQVWNGMTYEALQEAQPAD
ncbi:TPA: hypothetical protein NIB55_004246 [Pseudomonas aeruginosa]|nr:hypothetical protein [Pseudomonas aeruginosa]